MRLTSSIADLRLVTEQCFLVIDNIEKVIERNYPTDIVRYYLDDNLEDNSCQYNEFGRNNYQTDSYFMGNNHCITTLLKIIRKSDKKIMRENVKEH
jgi:hypothetical protein